MKTVAENIKPVVSIEPDTKSTDVNGAVVDTFGFDNLQAVVSVGVIDTGDGDETYVVKLQEGAASDGSDMADIADTTLTIAASHELKTIGVIGLGTGVRKRYQRVVLTVGGTTPSIVLGASFNLGRGVENPVIVPDAKV